MLLPLQLLAYLSKYPYVRQAFYKPRAVLNPALQVRSSAVLFYLICLATEIPSRALRVEASSLFFLVSLVQCTKFLCLQAMGGSLLHLQLRL